VDIIRDPSPSGEVWDGSWISQTLNSSNTISIALQVDAELQSTLLKIPFSHYVPWLIGFRNYFISGFLNAIFNAMFNLMSTLARDVGEEDRFKHSLVLLLQASLVSGKAPWLFADINRH
jgi:hypothetical protein